MCRGGVRAEAVVVRMHTWCQACIVRISVLRVVCVCGGHPTILDEARLPQMVIAVGALADVLQTSGRGRTGGALRPRL